jgi:hypothetical protein
MFQLPAEPRRHYSGFFSTANNKAAISRHRDIAEVHMVPSALPLISKHDYLRFQQMITELLATPYEEWRDDHAKSIAYRRSRNGSREISISPDEFAAWLKDNQTAAHLKLLWTFAEAKAERTAKR